jgi:hypothetical protein
MTDPDVWVWSFTPLQDCYLYGWNLNHPNTCNWPYAIDVEIFNDSTNSLTDGFGELVREIDCQSSSPNQNSILLKQNEIYRIVITNTQIGNTNYYYTLYYSNDLNTNFATYATDLGFARKSQTSNQFFNVNGSPIFRLYLKSYDETGTWFNMLKAPNNTNGYLMDLD